ncbi:MAG: SAM-dependent methyltransferase [Pseudomonadota bacterium]
MSTPAGSSQRVSTNQGGTHPNLLGLLARRQKAQHHYSYPHDEAFAALKHQIEEHNGPLILDSGCGTGASTERLAQANPKALVIGIDKSKDRLRRKPTSICSNAVIQLFECAHFWHLAQASRIRFAQHYILYPNPWPKKKHLARRWHGHAAFADLLALGGRLELRSNWKIYLEEFAQAAHYLTGLDAHVHRYQPAVLVSPFETKYHRSGHQLFRLVLDLR